MREARSFMPSSTIGVKVSTMGETISNSELLALLLFLDIKTPWPHGLNLN
jgi:hypothetical protein